MGISKVGFKFCNICNLVIQDIRYYEYKDQYYHIQKPCKSKIPPEYKDKIILKTVQPHKFPIKKKK